MDEYTELDLGTDVMAEFENYAAEGMATLGLTATSSPYDAVKAVGDFIDRWQSDRRDKSVTDDPKQVISTALSLGIVWGNAVCREFGWTWTCVEHKGSEWYIVAFPDRAYACYPTYDVRSLLNNPQGDNCAELVFNMMKAGQFPRSEPKRYLSLGFGQPMRSNARVSGRSHKASFLVSICKSANANRASSRGQIGLVFCRCHP
jgi:hypothetical protein